MNRQENLQKVTNMNRRTLFILALALLLSGCGGAGSSNNSVGAGNNAAAPSNANMPTVAGANNAAAPTPATVGNSAPQQPGATPAAGSANVSSAPPANAPKPQIGSGGNDFALFMQARGAINSDADLQAANIIIEVKDGVVSLSGPVASVAQKSKAEKLVLDAGGAKSGKNQIRVSSGK